MFEEEVAGRFRDRQDAADQLAEKLKGYGGMRPVILALSGGGVVLGYHIAKRLRALLDMYGVRTLRAPDDPGFVIGAISQGGVLLLDDHSIGYKKLPPEEIKKVIAKERDELERELLLLGNYPGRTAVGTRVVILVDDGITTALPVRAAITSLTLEKPAKLIVAVPVCPSDLADMLEPDVDELIVLRSPASFSGLPEWYENLPEVSEAQAVALLHKAREGYPKIPDVP